MQPRRRSRGLVDASDRAEQSGDLEDGVHRGASLTAGEKGALHRGESPCGGLSLQGWRARGVLVRTPAGKGSDRPRYGSFVWSRPGDGRGQKAARLWCGRRNLRERGQSVETKDWGNEPLGVNRAATLWCGIPIATHGHRFANRLACFTGRRSGSLMEQAEGGTEIDDRTFDPRRLLVDWANEQDAWVRRLVGIVLSSRRPIGDMQAAELYDMYLTEKGLQGGGSAPEPEPDLAYPTDGAASAEELRLIRLSNVDGVNALTSGSEIEFCDNLTILYGENGTGKTGYARVLKRLAALRDAEEIVPNIHGSGGTIPTAQIDYRLGEAEKTLAWQNQVGVSPFTRMSIFDSPAVNVRVDENLSYVVHAGRDFACSATSMRASAPSKSSVRGQFAR